MAEAQTARGQPAELEGTNAVDRQETALLEDERDVAQGRQRALDAVSIQLQQEVGTLRQHPAASGE
jgi:hypothetical protein